MTEATPMASIQESYSGDSLEYPFNEALKAAKDTKKEYHKKVMEIEVKTGEELLGKIPVYKYGDGPTTDLSKDGFRRIPAKSEPLYLLENGKPARVSPRRKKLKKLPKSTKKSVEKRHGGA